MLAPNWVVSKVPIDVWRSIFQSLVAQMPSASDSTHAALTLTHVCSSWRSIARHAPELWTVVQVKLPSTTAGTTFPNADLLSLILRNSAMLPLTMELLAKKTSPYPKREFDESVRRFMLEIHRSRVLRLSFWVLDDLLMYTEEDMLKDILNMASDLGAPSLKEMELDLRNLEHCSGMCAAFLVRLWKRTPVLDTLVLCGRTDRLLDLNYIDKQLGCPFHQIIRLEINAAIHVKSFITVMSSMSCLEIAKFQRFQGPIPTGEVPTIFLPALRILHLGGEAGLSPLKEDSIGDSDDDEDEDTSCPPLTELLALLKAPGLVELRLHRDQEFSLNSFQSFIRSSGCKIENLGLDVENSDSSDGLECLRTLPSLRILDVSTTFTMEFDDLNLMSDDLLMEMARWDPINQKFDLCPDLEKITIDHDLLRNHLTEGLFSAMVEERWKRHSRHFEVVVKGLSIGHHDEFEWFKDTIRLLVLKRDGLNLTLTPDHWLEEVICRK